MDLVQNFKHFSFKIGHFLPSLKTLTIPSLKIVGFDKHAKLGEKGSDLYDSKIVGIFLFLKIEFSNSIEKYDLF